MTMITFTGLTVAYDGSDNVVSVGPTTVSLILPSSASTFSYSIIATTEDLPWVDIMSDAIQVQIDYRLMEDWEASGTSDIETDLGNVTSSGSLQ